jgi:hypothetical protein
LRGILLQISQLKLELIQQRATFRGLTEPLMPQLADRVFELLDQQRTVLRFALRGDACRTLGNEHRLQRLDIIGQRISGAHRLSGNHKPPRLSEPPDQVWIQNVAISRRLAVATCAAASANR